MRVWLSRDVESRQLWCSLYHSIALLVLKQQCVDTGSMLSPALPKHKDFRAPGHEMSQKLRKMKEFEWDRDKAGMTAQISSSVTWVSLTGVTLPPPSLTCIKIFLHTCDSPSFHMIRGHSVQWTPRDTFYCQDWEVVLVLGEWRLMERYEG